MEIDVLGPMVVRDQGQEIDVGSRMSRLLLAALVLQPGVPVSLDRLIDALWGEAPPPGALKALHVHVATLRRALEPGRARHEEPKVLVTQRSGYCLRVANGAVDAERFIALVKKGQGLMVKDDPAEAAQTLFDALQLWRGTPYADVATASFLQPEIVRLSELRAGAEEDLAEAGLAAGDHARLIGELERLANEEPIRERRWELLALALYRSGRQTEALRVIEQARRALVEDSGIELGVSLRRLEQDILRQAPSLDWRPPRRAAARPAAAGRDALRQPLVGRETELAQLQFAMDQAIAGQGGIALISGEPGIGKTRLAEELSDYAAAKGVQVAWGRAPEVEIATAYWPWVRIVRTLATEAPPEAARAALANDAEELVRLVPEVTDVVGRKLLRRPEVASDTARTRLYDAVVGFTLRLSTHQPLLVVIDDLHWADVQTLQLVQLLAARSSAAAPILLVATYRPHDVGTSGPVMATLASLARVPNLLRVQPEGLTEPDIGVLVAHTTGADARPDVAKIICARTDGNPFFVTELLRLLHAKGQLSEAESDALRSEVPLAVRDVILQRLARLDDSARALLAAASVVGQTFEADLAAGAATVDEDRALESLESALAVGVVLEHPSAVGLYRFSHSLVRQTIYDGLSGLRRARLHRNVAVALARAGDDNRAVEIADHYFAAGSAAGDGEEAYKWALRAADRAALALAFEQAEGLLDRAMELGRKWRPEIEGRHRELAAQRRIAGVRLMRHWYASPEVGEAWTRAVELARGVESSPDVLSSLWGAWCFRYIRNDLTHALDHADELRRRSAEQSRASESAAAAAAELPFDVVGNHCAGVTCIHLGRYREAFERFDRVAERIDLVPADFFAGPLFEPDPRLAHRMFRGVAECLVDGPEGLQTLDRSVEDARAIGRPLGVVAALILATVGRALGGDHAGAEPLATEGAALSEEHGFRLFGAMLATLEGWAQADAGTMRKGIVSFLETGSRLMLPLFWGLLADLDRQQGRTDEALDGVRRALAVAESTGERFWAPELHRLHGDLLLDASPGALAEAERAFRAGLALARSQGASVLEERLLGSRARLK